MRRSLRALVLGAGLSFACARAQAPLDLRVALVIGNAAYAAAPLANPANDAKAMSEVLRTMGFTVIEARDASKAQMEAAIVQAGAALKGRRGVGMLYYAGHGLQLDWHNYMVPVDARLSAASDVPQQTVDIGTVLDAFRVAGTRTNILVLDACRDNPFAGQGLTSGKGLAQLDAPSGTFLAYATAPGNVAEDGDDRSGNGLYTRYLLQELVRPDARIEEVFKRVRMKVRQSSQGRQIPWESTSLEDEFLFTAKPEASRAGDAKSEATRQAPLPNFAAQKTAWDKIKASTNPKDLYAFLDQYPTGELSEAALSRLNQLAKPQIVATVGKGESPTLAYTGERFRVGDSFTFRTFDKFSNKVTGEFTRKVVAITDGVVNLEVDTGISYRTTLLGGTIDTRAANGKSVTYDPPAEPDPAEFYIGKRWEGETNFVDWDGIRQTTKYSTRIIGTERIVLPAGSFDTYVMEVTISNSNGSYEQVRKWVDPRYGMSVRRESTGRRGGQIYKFERRELVAVAAPRS